MRILLVNTVDVCIIKYYAYLIMTTNKTMSHEIYLCYFRSINPVVACSIHTAYCQVLLLVACYELELLHTWLLFSCSKIGGVHDTLHISSADWWDLLLPLTGPLT